MRLSDLHPCNGCGGPLTSPAAPGFFVVRISMAVPDPVLASTVAALATDTGRALLLAETLVDNPEAAIRILGDENPALERRVHLCASCYTLGRLPAPAEVRGVGIPA